jgi:ribosome-binding protein aMBF1 (putative translation factor)
MGQPQDFAKLLAEQIKSDDGFADDMDRERLNGEIAVLIYAERTKAGLTQKELADKAGTHQSVIARLEDAEYNGRTIELLRCVLRGLGLRLAVSAEPLLDSSAIANILQFPPPKVWNPPTGSPPIETQTSSAQAQ